MTEPILTPAVCIYCGHEWEALCPDGVEVDYLECPKCGKDGGKGTDE